MGLVSRWLMASAFAFGSATYEEDCQELDHIQAAEEEEAMTSSTVLLQASLRQSRGSSVSQVTAGAEMVGPLLRIRNRRDIEFVSTSDLESMTGSGPTVEASDFMPLFELVNTSMGKDSSDPVWASAHELIRRYLINQNPDTQEYVRLCDKGKLEQYTNKACASTSAGSALVNGNRADSYYCGSRVHSIDWSGAHGKVNDLCHAEAGSAYKGNGICGSLSKKQLVLNFFETVPKWKQNPLLLNVPSVDCILGLGDCDIHYCQDCSALCGLPKNGTTTDTTA